MHIGKRVLPLRRQAEIWDKWLLERLNTILPDIMKKENMDMWIVLGREYNEDPVMFSLLPSALMNATRLTGFIFFMNKDGVLERYSLFPLNSGILKEYYTPIWDKANEDQWQSLAKLVDEKKPKVIGINQSADFAIADGLSHTLYTKLRDKLGHENERKLVSAERVVLGWLEKRTKTEIEAYGHIMKIIHDIINEAFSKKVIMPGTTTTTDVEWWMMQTVKDLGLSPWFPFSVVLQRRGRQEKRISNEIIKPGDLIACDVGLKYLGLHTDTQRMGYVLNKSESEAPLGIKSAFYTCNKLQDILASNFIEGRTGNEIFNLTIEEAKKYNIKAQIYSHPIGFHGHGAGPTIGLWDMQHSIPGKGDYELNPDTCYAMELNISQRVPEWDDQDITIFLEETVVFTEEKVHYLNGRQTELILI